MAYLSTGASSVGTAQITDDSIINADINSAAAIAYSKLALTGSIVNADIGAAAAIVDTKLATISTAGKVAGDALTSLANIPAGAGVIPSANLPTIASVPTGAITAYGGATAPTGYLLCDGTAVSRTTYAALFAITSTLYGVGDSSTTFNVPDMRGRVAVGKNAATFGTQGATGGEETHALITAELAAHTHNANVYTTDSGSGVSGVLAGTQVTAGDLLATTSTGSGTAHNNIQPYQVHQYIIKT